MNETPAPTAIEGAVQQSDDDGGEQQQQQQHHDHHPIMTPTSSVEQPQQTPSGIEESTPPAISTTNTPDAAPSLPSKSQPAAVSTKTWKKRPRQLRNFHWRQRYYFYIHIAVFVVFGLTGGLLLYILEFHHSHISLIDALFTAVSSVCVTGLITVDPTALQFTSMILIFVCFILGSFVLSTIPALIIKIVRAHQRMIARRKQQLGPDRTTEVADEQLLNPPLVTEFETTPNLDTSHSVRLESSGIFQAALSEQQQLGNFTTVSSQLSNIRNSSDSQHKLPTPSSQPIELQITGTTSDPSKLQQTEPDGTDQTQPTILQPDDSQIPTIRTSRSISRLSTHEDTLHIEPDTPPIEAPPSIHSTPTVEMPPSIEIETDAETETRRRKVMDFDRGPMDPHTLEVAENIIRYNAPPPTEIEFQALILILIIIVATLLFFMSIGFVVLGLLLQFRYSISQLDGINHWFVALFLSSSSTMNSGFVPFADDLERFVTDIPVIIVLCILILAGNNLFPLIVRTIVVVCHRLSRRRKLVFQYLLDNHHHLTLHLFPGLETGVYLTITVGLQLLSVSVGLIMEYNNAVLAPYGTVNRVFVLIFQSISTRTAGYYLVDIKKFSIATLCVYLLMMRTKSQMFCALSEQAYNIVAVLKKFRNKQSTGSTAPASVGSTKLQNQSYMIESRLGTEHGTSDTTIRTSIDATGARRRMASSPTIENINGIVKELMDYGDNGEEVDVRHTNLWERIGTQLVLLSHKIWYHAHNLLIRNNSWMMVMIFGICAIESKKMVSDPVNFSLFAIIFEVISAFGNAGLSLKHDSNPSVSLSGMFSVPSKLLIMLAMLFGRHRGLQQSMKDQELNDYSPDQMEELAVKI